MSLQFIVIGAYLGVLLILGFLGWKASKGSAGEYYLAGRNQGWIVTSLTICATYFSSMAVLGVPGLFHQHGIGGTGTLSIMLSAVLIWFFGTRIWRIGKKHGFVTQAELFSHHYKSETMRIVVTLLGACYVVTYVIMQIMAGGLVFQEIVDSSFQLQIAGRSLSAFETGVIGMAIITAGYTMAGGMRSVAWTDVLQGILLLVGIWISGGVVLIWLGGPFEIFAQVNEHDVSRLTLPGPKGAYPIAMIFTVNIAVAIGNILQPAQWMRYYAAGGPRVLKRAALVFAILLCGTMVFVTPFIGLGGWLIFPDIPAAESDQIVLKILEEAPVDVVGPLLGIVWPAFAAVFMTAIMAASMSTADSNLHAASAMLTRDVYQRYIKADASPARVIWCGRLTIAGLTGLAVIIILSGHTSAIAVIGFLAASFSLQLLPATIDVLFLNRGTRMGAFAGMVVGVSVLVVFAVPPFLASWFPGLVAIKHWNGIHCGCWGLAANAAVFVSVSFLTKKARTVPA